MMKRAFFAAFICMMVSGIARSQTIEREVIASAGDYFVASTFSLSWTLGEPITETVSKNNVTLTQGFQQADKITVTSIKQPLAEQFDISVYPNPTADVLNINILSDMNEIITVQLYSLTGNSIISEKTHEKNIQLNLNDLPSASYMLSLRKLNGQLITTYVINKTK